MNTINTLLILSPQHMWEKHVNQLAIAFIIALSIGLISSVLYGLYFICKSKK